jgi:hypothetical protein
MPIEIRELVIRATVDPGNTGGGGGGCGASSSGTGSQAPAQSQTGSNDDLVQTCVREVLRILDDKRER